MTNPTPSAEERAANTARSIALGLLKPQDFPSVFAEQIRQAEQAARADERAKFKRPLAEGEREFLGSVVRHVWVEWANEQPNCKSSWLVPWADLDEGQREVDMRIGERLKEICYPRWVDAIEDARADERCKTLEEAAQIVNAARGESTDLRVLVHRIRALSKSSEPGEAA